MMFLLGGLLELVVGCGFGCLGFFLFSFCCVSPDVCSRMSSIVFHCSCVLIVLRLLYIGEYSTSSLVILLVQYSCSFFVSTSPASCNDFFHSTVNAHGVSGILGLTLGIRPLRGLFVSILVAVSGDWLFQFLW